MAFVVLFTAFGFAFTTNADYASARIGSTASTDGGAQERLRSSVDDEIANNKYVSESGDTIPGSQLVKNGITTSRFTELTSKEKQRLIDDMTNAVSAQQSKDVENDANNPVTDDTVTNWLQELQQQPGVGSKLLGNITTQIKPDYVTAQRIMEPFNGPLNTIIALGAILLMTMLTVTFVADLSYLNVPVFQSFIVSSMKEGGGGGRYTNFFVGREALQAIEESENSSNGKAKNPNGIYFKKRIIGLALLGICLLYLIQGQIFILVGMLMDLLGGFLE